MEGLQGCARLMKASRIQVFLMGEEDDAAISNYTNSAVSNIHFKEIVSNLHDIIFGINILENIFPLASYIVHLKHTLVK